MNIVANLAQSWKWLSMQTAALATTVGTVALAVPAGRTHEYLEYAILGLNALTMYARLIQQTPSTPDAVQAQAALHSIDD
ncbi:MAG: hypothetical protein ACREPT_01625, partial [Rudaea sp.]